MKEETLLKIIDSELLRCEKIIKTLKKRISLHSPSERKKPVNHDAELIKKWFELNVTLHDQFTEPLITRKDIFARYKQDYKGDTQSRYTTLKSFCAYLTPLIPKRLQKRKRMDGCNAKNYIAASLKSLADF